MQLKKIKRLFIFRHGPTNHGGFLTEEGRLLIQRLGYALGRQYKFEREKTAVICSRELRAIKTAQCLISCLSTGSAKMIENEQCYQELFSNDNHCDVGPALELIKTYADDELPFENIIIITHLELASVLPTAICSACFGATDFVMGDVNHGRGYFIDCEKETCQPVKY